MLQGHGVGAENCEDARYQHPTSASHRAEEVVDQVCLTSVTGIRFSIFHTGQDPCHKPNLISLKTFRECFKQTGVYICGRKNRPLWTSRRHA